MESKIEKGKAKEKLANPDDIACACDWPLTQDDVDKATSFPHEYRFPKEKAKKKAKAKK